MPFKPLTGEVWERRFRRCLLVGLQGAWKTSSLDTWPKPIRILNTPGEQGVAAITLGPGVEADVWEEDASKSPRTLYETFRKTVIQAIGANKYQTVAIEGLHKLYELIYDGCLEGLVETMKAHQNEEDMRGAAYGRAHKEFTQFIGQVNGSSVPYVVMTAWASAEKDDRKLKDSDAHYFPDFPGEMSKRVLGEFGAILFSHPGKEVSPGLNGAPGKYSAGSWQTRPHGRVWGVGLKVPREVAPRIPTLVPQNWQQLEALVLGKGEQK